MFEISALIAAIIVLIIIVLLRTILAMVFPIYQAKIVSIVPPASVLDLFESADSELREAGFTDPVWLKLDCEPAEANDSPVCAVYRHRESHMLAWLMMPMNVARPNKFNQFYTTTLEDGRVVTSQVFDLYFSLVASDEAPAQTLHTESIHEQVAQHKSFVAEFSSSPQNECTSNSTIIHLASEHMNHQRESLIKDRLLWVDGSGIARPRLRFALKIMWTAFRMKKPDPPSKAVPPGRLTLLANYLERVRHREPSLRSQMTLFLFSIVLSVIVGALVWNVQFAVVLLAVVIFHELGHYIAMRIFGYKNVHMMALPLVGGVTIGIDTNPNAWRRAWMSMMGPLPGIILGWAVLYFFLNSNLSDDIESWFKIAAILLLFINYLNILPVLPLDGGHVVQSLLPPRLLKVHALIISILCLLGIAAAFYLQFYILMILFGSYLFSLASYRHVGKVVHLLTTKDAPIPVLRSSRLLQIFHAYEKLIGPAKNAKQRIAHAEQVLMTLEIQPMTWGQRGIVGIVYSVLLVVPIAVIVVSIWFDMYTSNIQADNEIWREKYSEEYAQFQHKASQLSTLELFTEIINQPYNKESVVDPASESAIRAAESRLNIVLPDDLRTLYRIANGVPGIGLLPVEKIGFVRDLPVEQLIPDDSNELTLNPVNDFEEESLSTIIKFEQLHNWLYIAGVVDKDNDDAQQFIYLNVSGENIESDATLLEQYSGYTNVTAYSGIRHWLEYQWISIKQDEQENRKREILYKQVAISLQNKDIENMLEMYEKPSMTEKLLSLSEPFPPGASDEEIRKMEQRLDVSFPEDMKTMYRTYNGFPPLNLFSLNEILPYSSTYDDTALPQTEWVLDSGSVINIEPSGLVGCYVIGGYRNTRLELKNNNVIPIIIWCTQSHANQGYFYMSDMHIYHTMTEYVKARTVTTEVAKQLYNE